MIVVGPDTFGGVDDLISVPQEFIDDLVFGAPSVLNMLTILNDSGSNRRNEPEGIMRAKVPLLTLDKRAPAFRFLWLVIWFLPK